MEFKSDGILYYTMKYGIVIFRVFHFFNSAIPECETFSDFEEFSFSLLPVRKKKLNEQYYSYTSSNNLPKRKP